MLRPINPSMPTVTATGASPTAAASPIAQTTRQDDPANRIGLLPKLSARRPLKNETTTMAALITNRANPTKPAIAMPDSSNGNDDLKAKSPQLDIAGSGRMDLVSTELDYALRAQVLVAPATERSALAPGAGRVEGRIEGVDVEGLARERVRAVVVLA